MSRRRVVDDIPVQMFRPVYQIAGWVLFAMAVLVGLTEAFYADLFIDGVQAALFLVDNTLHLAFEWGIAMAFFGLLGLIGKYLEKALVSGIAGAGAAFGYIGFTIAAIYDHAIFGQPELIVAVMTLTLASMYLLVASLDFFVLSRRRRGNS